MLDKIALLPLIVACIAVASASAPLTVELGEGSESEKAAQTQLLRLVHEYDVHRWLFTDKVLIDDGEWIPHSHPVLTLNSRYLENDLSQLATFLHEQFHWYAAERQDQVESAIAEFRVLFPDVPSGRAGARSEYSTYLHLIICDLELGALQKLVGDEKARSVLNGWQHYTWIYDQALNNPEIRRINVKYSLVPP